MVFQLCLPGAFSDSTIDEKSVEDPLIAEFQSRSHPPDANLLSQANPWGERLEEFDTMPADFPRRVVSAAKMYALQGIRFDGYFGSSDDGKHYYSAADGQDGAYYGDAETQSYRVVKDGVVDDLKERVWICLDLIMHVYSMAGYPIRQKLVEDYEAATYSYTLGGAFPENKPTTNHFFRRVRNVQLFIQRHHQYSEQRITKEQYRDPDFRPSEPFQLGDLLFFGHYGDADGEDGWWRAQHTGIVASVDARGLPVTVYNQRVSKSLVDEYDGKINQTRTVNGEPVFFERFSDRYSLIGFGRIVKW